MGRFMNLSEIKEQADILRLRRELLALSKMLDE